MYSTHKMKTCLQERERLELSALTNFEAMRADLKKREEEHAAKVTIPLSVLACDVLHVVRSVLVYVWATIHGRVWEGEGA